VSLGDGRVDIKGRIITVFHDHLPEISELGHRLKWKRWNMPNFFRDFLLHGVFAELILESTILQLINADVRCDTSGKESVTVQHDERLDVM
jgi:hypothetical protein